MAKRGWWIFPEAVVLATFSMSVAPSDSVMGLTYSNQWIEERIGAYLYASYNSGELESQVMNVGRFSSDFGSQGFGYVSVDLFSHLLSFAKPESSGSLRDWSLWGRYSVGFADRNAKLADTQTGIDTSSDSDSLLVFTARIGALLSYDHFTWIRPYGGWELMPYLYRNTADLSGAEQQGVAFCTGPVIGAHFPILFEGRASLLAEYRRVIPISDSGQIFANSNSYSAGLGVTF